VVIAARTAKPELIGIYLNDHYAGATAGVDLARRIAAAHRDTKAGPVLQRVAAQIAEDRVALKQIMDQLGVGVARHKIALAWLAEKAGRLKLNGRLFRRSPLSSLLELESMTLGVHGKAAGWRAMYRMARHDDRIDTSRLDTLLARADWQVEALEEQRIRAAEKLVGGGSR